MVYGKGRSNFTMTVLTLLLTTFLCFVKDVSACPLCVNGEEITNPVKRLGITNPLSLETCLDLSNAVGFLAEGSELCLQSRALGGLCGCPVPPTACTMCAQGSNMTQPLQVLDGLVELDESGTSFGLDTTCELVESAIGLYDETAQLCLDLPFDKLRSYCACSGTPSDEEIMVVENTATCNICVGGELLWDVSESSFIYQERLITCRDAVQLASSTVKGSDVCKLIQDAGTICGCPIPDDACELCRGGFLGEASKEIVLVDGEVIACNVLEARLHLVDESSQECSSTDVYAAECGCTAGVEFQPCTLCPLGESVPYPERNVSGIDGLGFDYVEHNCAAMEYAITFSDVTSVTCKTAQVIGKLCGCAVKQNACSICGAGNTMTKPLALSSWALGNSVNFLPDLAATIDADQPFTCELVDSTLSYWYEMDHNICFYIHLTKGSSCGCEGSSKRQVKAVIWTQRCIGCISLIGSSCIVFFILSQPTKKRWSMFHQLMFGISCFDALSSVGFILGTLPVPENRAIYGGNGNESTCSLQGWIFQAGQISMYYNVVLSMYFLLIVKHDWQDRRFQVIGKYVHAGIIFVGLGLAFASIPYQEPNYRWCYVAWPPIGGSYTPGLVFFIVPVGLCILALTILTVMLVKHVNQVENKTRGKSLSTKVSANSMASRTFWQSLWFLAAFYLVWPVLFATFIMPHVPENFWLLVVGSVLGPSQGFFNACIFFNRRRRALKKKIYAIFRIKSKRKASTPAGTGIQHWTQNTNETDPPTSSLQFPSCAHHTACVDVLQSAAEKSVRVSELTSQGKEGDLCLQEIESARQASKVGMGAIEHAKLACLCSSNDHINGSSLRFLDLVTIKESIDIQQQMESFPEEFGMSLGVLEHALLAGLIDCESDDD